MDTRRAIYRQPSIVRHRAPPTHVATAWSLSEVPVIPSLPLRPRARCAPCAPSSGPSRPLLRARRHGGRLPGSRSPRGRARPLALLAAARGAHVGSARALCGLVQRCSRVPVASATSSPPTTPSLSAPPRVARSGSTDWPSASPPPRLMWPTFLRGCIRGYGGGGACDSSRPLAPRVPAGRPLGDLGGVGL